MLRAGNIAIAGVHADVRVLVVPIMHCSSSLHWADACIVTHLHTARAKTEHREAVPYLYCTKTVTTVIA